MRSLLVCSLPWPRRTLCVDYSSSMHLFVFRFAPGNILQHRCFFCPSQQPLTHTHWDFWSFSESAMTPSCPLVASKRTRWRVSINPHGAPRRWGDLLSRFLLLVAAADSMRPPFLAAAAFVPLPVATGARILCTRSPCRVRVTRWVYVLCESTFVKRRVVFVGMLSTNPALGEPHAHARGNSREAVLSVAVKSLT